MNFFGGNVYLAYAMLISADSGFAYVAVPVVVSFLPVRNVQELANRIYEDVSVPYSDDDLNLLYYASLEWGEHWLRPLIEWAQELWPEWDAEKQAEISRYIEAVRDEINEHINRNYDYKTGKFAKDAQFDNWIKGQYPWMTHENISRGISQGMYYAWHG